jgi:conjugal transfer mating pair stabilization protein TraN
VQGRQQLGIGWGDHKNPDCRSLNLEEIRRLDFSKIDFTELYTDIVDKVSSGMNASQEKINQKMGSYKDGGAAINDKSTSEMINKKIKQFYEQKK